MHTWTCTLTGLPWKVNPTYGRTNIEVPLELKMCPQRPPILTYLDSDKPYFLLIDTSKYCLGATLCQYTCKQNSLGDLQPITLISGKFSDTVQLCSAYERSFCHLHVCQKVQLLAAIHRMHHTRSSQSTKNTLKGKTERNRVNNWST